VCFVKKSTNYIENITLTEGIIEKLYKNEGKKIKKGDDMYSNN